ncbi:amidohydrolase [Glacieibacterium megasporae]|uniref:amidohydrolase n=1 Tax=Glacieibacterium megasporae TaxID=2835787 RepID=UPI001C1DED47|nr:amidohydrolase [Polymorphobacter megasporae]UAJ09733.1 amidohydrolase [Polymorphobacter megasporae]
MTIWHIGIVATLVLAAPLAARTVVVNANGYTLDDAGTLTRFGTLVVGDDGRVEATLAKGVAAPAGTVVDAHGATVLPGLIDAHGHIMELGYRALSVDLTGTKSLAEALARVKAYAKANPTARWIVGGGWNQEIWQLGRFPTAAELDAAVGDRPVWLNRVDGHAGWTNSAGLRAAGVTAATADPAGGRIERGPGGAPSGVFVDGAQQLVDKHLPQPTPAEATAALTKALAIMASVGLTGAADMGIDPGTWKLYRAFDADRRLTARITAMAGGIDSLRAIAPSGPVGWSGDEFLSLPGVKLYDDGALGSRGAWLKADYSDAPGNRGLQFHSDAELRGWVDDATGHGFQVATHAIGDAANAQVLDAYARVPAATRQSLRLRIEHAQIVDPADLPRFASLGVIASMQPTHATSDKNMAENRLGAARLAGAYAWKTLIDSGARFAGGSDFPVESPNPFYGLYSAVTRQDHEGNPPGGWRPAEKLTTVQALAAFTTGAAYAAHAETRVGTLTPGKWADFIIVDHDLFVDDPATIWRTKVSQTWVGGKRVF